MTEWVIPSPTAQRLGPTHSFLGAFAAIVVAMLLMPGSAVGSGPKLVPAVLQNDRPFLSSSSVPVANRTWVNLTSLEPTSPPGLAFPASAWDPSLDGVLLYGGMEVKDSPNDTFHTAPTASNLTWLNRNGSWVELHPSQSPPPLAGASLAYDAADGYLVLFGGAYLVDSVVSNRTFVFVNNTWSELATVLAPPARAFAAMAYDSADRELVLFGGAQTVLAPPSSTLSGLTSLSDTWTFSGGKWSEVNASGPAGRYGAAISNGGLGIGAVLYGGGTHGAAYSLTVFNDTWEFRGGAWSQVNGPGPSARTFPLAALDPMMSGVLLYGGTDSGGVRAQTVWGLDVLNCDTDTWELENGSWTNVTGTFGHPDCLATGAMQVNPQTGSAIAFGGINSSSPPSEYYSTSSDTWALRPDLQVGVVHAFPSGSTGEVGESVVFVVNSSGGLGTDRWVWSGLPNGCGHVDGPSVHCVFIQNGTYTIQSQAADLVGSVAGPPLPFVVLPGPASGTPTPSKPSADAGQTVNFTAHAQAGAAPYERYIWRGIPSDCTGTNGPTATCLFESPGAYSISTTVTDALGGTSVPSPSLAFDVFGPPHVELSASRSVADEGQTITFVANGTGGSGGYMYAWAGVPTACTGASVLRCAFSTRGNYQITTTLTDSNGLTVWSTPVTVSVSSALVVATPTVSGSALAGRNLTFAAVVNGGTPPLTYSWRFGDGSVGSGALPKHSYENAGNYTVTVLVSDSVGASAQKSIPITVASAIASPSHGPTGPTEAYLVAGGVMAALVVAGVVLLRRSRRKASRIPA